MTTFGGPTFSFAPGAAGQVNADVNVMYSTVGENDTAMPLLLKAAFPIGQPSESETALPLTVLANRYPTPPANRIPYDRNGSTVFTLTTAGAATQVGASTVANLNAVQINVPLSSDGGLINISAGSSIVVLFAALQDISAFFYSWTQYFGSNTVSLSYSKDTTNGVDGNWTTINAAYPYTDVQVRPYWRTMITRLTTPLTGVRAFKITNPGFANGVRNTGNALHLYGGPTTPVGLEFWHPTLDVSLPPAGLDFADVARNVGQVYTKSVRLKNRSSTQTAVAPVVTLDALYEPTPTVLSQMTLVDAGGAPVTTLTLPNLAPGAISQAFTVRYTPVPTATISAWEQRVLAEATSWS